MRPLREIEHEVFYDGDKFSQLVIDIVEDVAIEVGVEGSVTSGLGHLSYRIDTVLDIIDPTRADDIRILKELTEHL